MVGLRWRTWAGRDPSEEWAQPRRRPRLAFSPEQRPILITGAHRSGTSWIAEVLAQSRAVTFVDEPFNRDYWPSWLPYHLPHWFQYICTENESGFVAALRHPYELRYPLRQAIFMRTSEQALTFGHELSKSLVGRAQHRRVLCKEPIGVFSAPWVAQKFNAAVIVCIRHPAAFVSSLCKLGWSFDFSNWTRQALFMRDCAGPYRSIIESCARNQPPVLEQAIVLWKVIYHRVRQYQADHPDWYFVRHEDLGAWPLVGFKRIFNHVDLPMTPRVRRYIEATSAATNPQDVAPADFKTVHRDSVAAVRSWQSRLDAKEIAAVRDATAEEASWFYTDESWELPPRR